MPPTSERIARLLRSPALVDGKQIFAYKGETRGVHYPGLQGTVPSETFALVQRALLPAHKEPRSTLSAWQRCLGEIRQAGVPLHVLVEDSLGALEYSDDGAIVPRCRHCRKKAVEPAPAMRETDAFYSDIVLIDGVTRRNYPVPVFACEGCDRTTRPVGLDLLAYVLAGHTKLACPRCRSTGLELHIRPMPSRGRIVQVSCKRCGFDFEFAAGELSGDERFRFLRLTFGERKPEPRPEPDLRSFDEAEGSPA